MDGSCLLGSSNIGAGGLVRDHNGDFCVGFSSSDGVDDASKAEILAVLHGLDLTWNKGFRKVRCETDSLDVYNCFQLRVCPPLHPHSASLLEGLDLLHQSWDVSFSHVCREAFCTILINLMIHTKL